MSAQVQDKVIDMNNALMTVESTQKLCQTLMKTPHYAKLGPEGIFAVIAKAKSLNIDPLDALNGGLYCVQGRVEMSSQMMNFLIRQSGHSVMRDQSSDDNTCILHGKRKDNGDTWTESFSIQEAKRAGIYRENGPWGKFPRDMLFARALSRLARQLFPDVIKGCYVEGEISSVPVEKSATEPKSEFISESQVEQLDHMCEQVPGFKERCLKWLNIDTFQKLEVSKLPSILRYVNKEIDDSKNELVEAS